MLRTPHPISRIPSQKPFHLIGKMTVHETCGVGDCFQLPFQKDGCTACKGPGFQEIMGHEDDGAAKMPVNPAQFLIQGTAGGRVQG